MEISWKYGNVQEFLYFATPPHMLVLARDGLLIHISLGWLYGFGWGVVLYSKKKHL